MLQRQQVNELPESPSSPVLLREACEIANRWLARFSPLLENLETLSADECRNLIAGIPQLQADGETVRLKLRQQASRCEAQLLNTLEQALVEVEARDRELRRRLGALAPGDPEGEVDLAAIQAKLAESAARREVEEATGTGAKTLPAHLELPASPGNLAGGAFMGVFAFGWLSFTTFHAWVMIGGMLQSGFGWIGAIALLGFYAIFWLVGIGMAWAAVMSLSREEIELSGRTLLMRRRLGLWQSQRRYELAKEARARLEVPMARAQGSNAMDIAVAREGGGDVRFGSGRPVYEQQQMISRINEYLQAQ